MVKPRNPYYKTPRSQVIPNKKKDMPPHDDFEEYEDDGQPDELQEWHDFDPDC